MCLAAIEATSDTFSDLLTVHTRFGLADAHISMEDLERVVARRRELLELLSRARSGECVGRDLLAALHAPENPAATAFQLFTPREVEVLGAAIGENAVVEYLTSFRLEDLLSLHGHRRDHLQGVQNDPPYLLERSANLDHMGATLSWEATEALLMFESASPTRLAEVLKRIPVEAAVMYVQYRGRDQPEQLSAYFDAPLPALRAAAIQKVISARTLPPRGDVNEIVGMLLHIAPGATEALSELLVYWDRVKSADNMRLQQLANALRDIVSRDPELVFALAQDCKCPDVGAKVLRTVWDRAGAELRESALKMEALRDDDHLRWRALSLLDTHSSPALTAMYARAASYVTRRAFASELIFDEGVLEAAARGFASSALLDPGMYAAETISMLDGLRDGFRYDRPEYRSPAVLVCALRSLAWLHVDPTRVEYLARWAAGNRPAQAAWRG